MSKHHYELNEFGVGKCSVPVFSYGCPNDFCDNEAYGLPDGKSGYVPGLACPGHGGPKAPDSIDSQA